jgi:hypothetical protein
MAKGQPLSRYQRGIVNRYYEHLDTLTVQRLQEAVSDLYVADDARKAERLWKTVQAALAKALPEDPRVERVVAARDVAALAKLVGDVAAGKGGKGKV